MKTAKVIAAVISTLGLIFTFGSVGNLDYMEACGQALSAADIFTEFAKAWAGLLIFAAGAAFVWLVGRYEEWKETSEAFKNLGESTKGTAEAFKRFGESRRNRA